MDAPSHHAMPDGEITYFRALNTPAYLLADEVDAFYLPLSGCVDVYKECVGRVITLPIAEMSWRNDLAVTKVPGHA